MVGTGREGMGAIDGVGTAISAAIGGFTPRIVGRFVVGAEVAAIDAVGATCDAASSLLITFASSSLELLLVMLIMLLPPRRRKKSSVSEISSMCPKASSSTKTDSLMSYM